MDLTNNPNLSLLTPEHKYMYTCEKCNLVTRNKKDYNKHLQTKKHKKNEYLTENENLLTKPPPQPTGLICMFCDKTYKSRVGLWYHYKKCNSKNAFSSNNIIITPEENKKKNENILEDDASINNQMIFELLKQNNEFKELIMEQNKKILELVNTGNITNNNITNNTTNNKFNLNVFLNEKCKDALNLTDFISNLNVGFADFENFGKIGYSNSISHIFIRGLKELDIYKRPIHCSDLKREVIHIKDDNTWKKDDEKEQMIKAIKMIEHKNIKQIPDWIKAHPTHTDIRSKKFDEYSKMLDQSMGEYEDEDNQKNYQKIIRTVAKEILVDKDK